MARNLADFCRAKSCDSFGWSPAKGCADMEVVEVAPQYDVGDKTALIATRAIMDVLATLYQRRQARQKTGNAPAATALLANAQRRKARNVKKSLHTHAHTTSMKLPTTLLALLTLISAAFAAEPIKLGYSDWPGWTAWENCKGEKASSKRRGST
jgi:hypothetical protein